MFKRTFWFTTGATAGFGGAMWIRRQVLRTVRRFAPEQVQAEVTTSVRRLGTDLRAAVVEARDSMAEREAELRAELQPGSGAITAPAPAGAVVSSSVGPVPAAVPGDVDGGRRRRGRRRRRGGARGESANGEPARHH
jgi:hypothetical protein